MHFVLLILLLVLGCTNPDVSDKCQYSDLSKIPTFIIKNVFSDNKVAYAQFEKDFVNNREEALKNWLMSTSTFSDVASKEEILLSKVGNTIGVQNTGIFRVTKKNNAKEKYILKIGKNLEEAPRLLKLQQSIVMHPECLLENKNRREVKEEDLSYFPKIVKIYAGENFTLELQNGQKTSLQLLLLEEAPGQVIYSFKKNNELALDVYRAVGKSLGYFHYLLAKNPQDSFENWITWKHGDKHAFNVFYDLQNKQVTFIDNENMQPNQNLSSFKSDFERSIYLFFHRSVISGYSLLIPYFNELIKEEAKRQGKLVANINHNILESGYIDPLSALTNALNRSEVQTKLINSTPFKEISMTYNHFSAFVQGYLEAMPAHKIDEIKVFFGSMCRRVSAELVRFYNYNTDEEAKNDIVTAIRHAFPYNFKACIDENRFE